MAKPTTRNPISIVDNGNYVTFTFGDSAIPVEVQKSDTCSISYYVLTLNTASYPSVTMTDVGITTLNYENKIIDCDHRFVTTPVTADAGALYNEIVGYFNTNPSVIVEITDTVVIAEITDDANWDSNGDYTGSTDGLVAGSYYYDLDANLKYEFDGTTLIRIMFNTEI